MRVLQWNIWYKEKIENVLKTLREVNADIICLQELTIGHERNDGIDTPKYLADKLGFNYFYKEAQTLTRKGEEGSYGNGIFSRYPITKTSFTYIQEPQEPDSNDYSKEGRVYVEATIQVEEKEYVIGTVHMSYTDRFAPTSAKAQETDELLKVLRAKKNNFLVGGDFNALTGSYTIEEVTKYLKNAGPDFGKKTWTTKPFSYNGFEANTLDWRLDYVFATPDIAIKSARILPTEYSDHLPVLIEF